MASSGIRRKVDDLGRVVIPAGIRRSLGIREGDPVEVSVEGERVVLAKPRDACVFCGREEDDLTGFRGRLVCRDCLASLGGVEERLRATTQAQAAGGRGPRGPADLPDWDAPTSPRPAARTTEGTPAAARPAPGPRVPARPSPPPPPRGHDEPPHRPEPARAPAVEPITGPREPEAAPHVPEAPSPEATPREPQERPMAGPRTGPEGEDEEGGATRGRRRPPYDPASTTAW
jgi:AbrB family transcriptional regulator, transcriptional pleiotropic regulator of transition state genes